MEKSTPSFISGLETFLKFATPIGAIIVFLVGIWHYKDSLSEEFKKEYWKKRYEVYEQLNDLAASIASTDDPSISDSLSREFWIMYRGRIILVEDKHVYEAMKSYGETLDHAKIPDSLHTLQRKAIDLANACRLSLKETWEPVPLNEIRTMNE